MEPISLYLHIPFCERKCIYCDFYSIEDRSSQTRFVDALCREIELKAEQYIGLKNSGVSTIFFGGGTPSLLTPAELERIVSKLKTCFRFLPNIEFTLECNPGTITEHNLVGYKEIGVNRLSFGVQSFHADELEWLSRIHSADDASGAVKAARAAGFDNINVDLMFALPAQTKEKLSYSIDRALELQTEHISAYNLTVEEGTPLNRMVKLSQVTEMDTDSASELYEFVQERMSNAGFRQYEISNYSRSSETRCKHNLIYWDGYKNYVSFGPSAHEFYEGKRAWNLSSLDRYLGAVDRGELPIAQFELPSSQERRTEILFCQLRSTGLDTVRFKQFFAEDIMSTEEMGQLLEEGMVEQHNELIRLTKKGYRYCDAIVVRLMNSSAISV